jgi:hypothetical protein
MAENHEHSDADQTGNENARAMQELAEDATPAVDLDPAAEQALLAEMAFLIERGTESKERGERLQTGVSDLIKRLNSDPENHEPDIDFEDDALCFVELGIGEVGHIDLTIVVDRDDDDLRGTAAWLEAAKLMEIKFSIDWPEDTDDAPIIYTTLSEGRVVGTPNYGSGAELTPDDLEKFGGLVVAMKDLEDFDHVRAWAVVDAKRAK